MRQLAGLSHVRDQIAQPPHIVEDCDGPGRAQAVAVARAAVAAAMKTQHVHPRGPAAGDAGNAVLDHQASFRRDVHLTGGKQKQIGRGFAISDLRGRRYLAQIDRKVGCGRG